MNTTLPSYCYHGVCAFHFEAGARLRSPVKKYGSNDHDMVLTCFGTNISIQSRVAW